VFTGCCSGHVVEETALRKAYQSLIRQMNYIYKTR
jgi:hypothetical protein